MQLYQPTITGSLLISGSIVATGGITVSGSIASASFAASASNAVNAATASFVTLAQTASFVTTAQTASFVANAQSASNAVTAQTASYANSLTVAGTLTAQTLVVQTITSSVDFVTGSTRFGSLLANTHVFTGSVSMTGSLAVVTNGTELQVGATGVNLGNALTDSHVISGSLTVNPGGLFVSSSGLVGIGTATPSTTLDVRFDSSSTDITGSGASSLRLLNTQAANTTNFHTGIWFRLANGISNKNGYIKLLNDASNATGDFAFILTQSGTESERVRIKGSGNVGIGTNNPTFLLDLQRSSAGADVGLRVQNTAASGVNDASVLHLGWSSNLAGYSSILTDRGGRAGTSAAQGSLYFNANQDTVERIRMIIRGDTGNVGIGTNSPSYVLHAKASSGNTTGLRLESSGGTSNFDLLSSEGDGNAYLYLRSNYNMLFGTNNTERMRITNGGSIQINYNPGGGDIYFRDTTNGAVMFYIIPATYVGTAPFNNNRLLAANSSNITFEAGGSERMRITSGGQVQIGGTTNTFVDFSGTTCRFFGGGSTNTFGLGAANVMYYQGDASQFYPTVDNTRSIGLASNRYTAIWAVNGTIQTSDEREKTDIINSDLGLDFVTKLRPVSFKWKIGQNTETVKTTIDEEGNEKTESTIISRAGIRTHYGLIAQEVEQLLNGKDFGGFIHDKKSDVKGLRYDQFVPLLIKAIQEQQAQIEELKARLT